MALAFFQPVIDDFSILFLNCPNVTFPFKIKYLETFPYRINFSTDNYVQIIQKSELTKEMIERFQGVRIRFPPCTATDQGSIMNYHYYGQKIVSLFHKQVKISAKMFI